MFLLLHRLLNSGKDNEPVNSTILAARPAADINMFLFPMLIQIYSAEACKTFLKKGRPLFLQRFPDKIKTGDYGKAGEWRGGGGGVSPPKLPCRWELHSGWHCSQVWINKKTSILSNPRWKCEASVYVKERHLHMTIQWHEYSFIIYCKFKCKKLRKCS